MADSDRKRWNERYQARPATVRGGSPFVIASADMLPTTGRALDLAGGDGRNAFWLAARGMQVTVADISEVALQRVTERAEATGLDVTTCELDLQRELPPGGPWDLIICVLYLDRALLGRIHELLAPGGLLVFVQPTVRDRERHKHAAGYLLELGEAPTLLTGLRLVHYAECWDVRGHHETRVVAIKP